MQLRISLIVLTLVAYINFDPGESCFVNRDRTIVLRRCSPFPGCQCGMANHKIGQNVNKPQGRIIEGMDAEKNEFPWHVGLVNKAGNKIDLMCGGSIVSSKTILTAAHCIIDGLWGVVVGEHDQTIADGEQYFELCGDVQKHPKYRQGKQRRQYDPYFYDYAILTLCKPLTWSRSVSPVCLPTVSGKGAQYENKELIVTGWGSTDKDDLYNQKPPAILQKVKLTTMTNAECLSAKYVYAPQDIDKTSLCALNPNKGVCYGDSGGPLVIQQGTKNQYFLIGIVSWGDMPCGAEQAPGVFSRVTEGLDWIKERIKGDVCPINSAVRNSHMSYTIAINICSLIIVFQYNIVFY